MLFGPAMAASQMAGFPAQPAGHAGAVYSVSTDSVGPRVPEKLRDLLRQTGDVSTYPSPPYRLSPEERQRLREQLRQQATSPGQPVR